MLCIMTSKTYTQLDLPSLCYRTCSLSVSLVHVFLKNHTGASHLILNMYAYSLYC